MCLVLISCNQSLNNSKKYQIGELIFKTGNFHIKEKQGIESKVLEFVSENNSKIMVEYGHNVFSLKEDLPTIMTAKEKENFEILSGKNWKQITCIYLIFQMKKGPTVYY